MQEKIHRITYKEYGHPLHVDGDVRTEDVGYFLTESKAIEFLRDGFEKRVIVKVKELTQEQINNEIICYMEPFEYEKGTKWTQN
tara:strand:- start:306 stop:557 length:252 start_codon:yes stop_codon:yes gene_type:complete